jgi:hypothetical protein
MVAKVVESVAEEDGKEGTGATLFSFDSEMAVVGAWHLAAEAEAAVDEINRAVNDVGVPKYEENGEGAVTRVGSLASK